VPVASSTNRLVGMRRRNRLAALPIHRHSLPQIALDAGLVALAYFIAYRLRFDGGVPEDYQQLFERTIAFVVIGSVVIFAVFGLYRHWMRYSSQREYMRIAQAALVAVLVLVGYVAVVQPKLVFAPPRGFVPVTIPASVLVLFGLLMFVLLAAVRYAVHLVYERPVSGFRARRGARSVLIVGAGDGGRLLLREILRNPDLGLRPVGFVDDDPRKQGVRVDRGLDVLGTTMDLPEVLEDVEPDEVLIAIPSAPGTLRARVVRACRERGVRVKTMPTVFELLQTGGRFIRQVREVRVEDVLGREPVRMEVELMGGYLTGRCVMVTGAGGSIGAELCRQIARVGPSRLVLLDHAEENLFEVERELVEDRHALNTVAVLADCKEEERMREVFREHRPTVVFHAAAYKHVGLMESNPVEAVRNNALATRVMARAAGDSGTSVFVQVSTDKAVEPATVMGASKALAEWAVEAADARYPDTAFTAVRFGNVLGSSGSVVPIFRRQIAAGGPVTVTDPAMTRFFMTIPEAVQLVIRAGSLAHGGEVFVLEMGEPVRIMDLAEDMIRFSGLEPGRDIAIDIVGSRPGEKLHEDLFNAYERPEATPAQKILRARRPAVDPAWVEETFDRIGLLVLEGDAAALAATVAELASARVAAEVPEPSAVLEGEAPLPAARFEADGGVELRGSRTAS
jgi:FlaA1/EpsC-like NDP-sugar epimerase